MTLEMRAAYIPVTREVLEDGAWLRDVMAVEFGLGTPEQIERVTRARAEAQAAFDALSSDEQHWRRVTRPRLYAAMDRIDRAVAALQGADVDD